MMLATGKDEFRKPSTGMWDLMSSELNGGVEIGEILNQGEGSEGKMMPCWRPVASGRMMTSWLTIFALVLLHRQEQVLLLR